MKRKFLPVFVAALLVLVFSFSSALAATGKEMKELHKMVDKANKQIEKAVKRAQKTEEDDVEELLVLVEDITGPVFDYADSIGELVICEYETYVIDGQFVEIDPLRVVNVGSGTGGNN